MQPIFKSSNFLGWWLAVALTWTALAAAFFCILFVAPVEAQMGVVQKIFYIHVPSAYAMYVGFIVAAVGSAGYLIRKTGIWDAIAVAGAEVGTLFSLIVLTTGPLWARRAWGTWWTWDPRLTTTVLAAMIFVAYLSLRSFGAAGEVEKRFAAGLAILGVLDLPLIHYSVQKWSGQHPTVITSKGGGLDPDMKITLAVCFLAVTFLVALLIWMRALIEKRKQAIEKIEVRVEQRAWELEAGEAS